MSVRMVSWKKVLGGAWALPAVLRQASVGAAIDSSALPEVTLEALVVELQELRQEQAELKSRLERCACAVGPGAADEFRIEARGDLDDEGQVASPSSRSSGEDGDGLVRVDASNAEWVKEVLFGGEPWVIHCIDRQSLDPDAVRVPAVLSEAARELRGTAHFGVIDCWQRMASGKTLAHRFDFPGPPLTFAVANGDTPTVLDLDGVVKPWQLKRKAAPLLAVSVERIDGPEKFKSLCVNRRSCLVVGFKTAPALANAIRTLTPILERLRGVRAVAVDTSVWKVKLDDKLAGSRPKREKGAGGDSASLLCLARRRASASRGGAFLRTPSGSLEGATVEEFVRRCADGRELVGFDKSPSISLRPPEAPKYRSPSAGERSSGGNTGSKGKRQAKREAKRAAKASAKAGRAHRGGGGGGGPSRARTDYVGSRRQLEEDQEPTFVEVGEDEADGGDAGDTEEEDWEEVEL